MNEAMLAFIPLLFIIFKVVHRNEGLLLALEIYALNCDK